VTFAETWISTLRNWQVRFLRGVLRIFKCGLIRLLRLLKKVLGKENAFQKILSFDTKSRGSVFAGITGPSVAQSKEEETPTKKSYSTHSGSKAFKTYGQVLKPSVFKSTKRYRVCPELVSKTPFLVGPVKNDELGGFWRFNTSRIGLMYSDSKVLA
jgi:hypothetical protein